MLQPGATRARGAGDRARAEAARPRAHLLRTRPRPDPALGRVPAAGRQDPGLRLPGGPPAHPAHPRPRGRPGGHRGGPRLRVERRADRGHRDRPRLRSRPRRARQRGGVRRLPAGRLRPRGVGRRRRPGPAEPVHADAGRRPQPLLVAPGAEHARRGSWSAGPTGSPTPRTTSRTPCTPGIVDPADLPDDVAAVCGRTRRDQLARLRRRAGPLHQRDRRDRHVARTTRAALAGLRTFNYERIYTRPEALAQSASVVRILRALVEHYLAGRRTCRRLPARRAAPAQHPGRRPSASPPR